MEFSFSGKAKSLTFILMGLGLVGLLIGVFTGHGEHEGQRFWSNVLINGFFFLAIALGSMFFYALQYAAEVGWSAQLKRLLEAMHGWVPWGLGVMLLVLIAGQMHQHHIYHWMDSSVAYEFVDNAGHEVEEGTVGAIANPNFDELIANKMSYFGSFFWVRTIGYCVVFIFFVFKFRQWSLQEDKQTGTGMHFKMMKRSAVFLVFFAVFSSTLSWDWIMSIDTHWFSTLFGWYLFSGMWVGCMIFVLVTILWMRTKGYFPNINQSHIHDISKWMFAISMLWSYLWFSQFMLIWYSDIPEEVTYYMWRFNEYKVPFLLMFFINFAVPFYLLMARDAKRNPKFLIPVAFIIFIGHFIDTYLLIIPGTMFDHNHFGVLEIGMFLLFLGAFIFVVLNRLSKAPLIPVNHPYLEESKELHH